MCDVLVLHGCLVVLSILPPFLLFFLVGEWGVEGEAACNQGQAFVCVLVLLLCERGEERKRKRGGEGGSRQGQPREREREGRRGEMCA